MGITGEVPDEWHEKANMKRILRLFVRNAI